MLILLYTFFILASQCLYLFNDFDFCLDLWYVPSLIILFIRFLHLDFEYINRPISVSFSKFLECLRRFARAQASPSFLFIAFLLNFMSYFIFAFFMSDCLVTKLRTSFVATPVLTIWLNIAILTSVSLNLLQVFLSCSSTFFGSCPTANSSLSELVILTLKQTLSADAEGVSGSQE